MIKINSNFMIKKDLQNWILTETKMGISRSAKNKGEEIKVTTQTYHPNTEMVARAIIDRLGDADCDSLKELIEVYKESISLLSEHVSFICTSDSAEAAKMSAAVSETGTATTTDDNSELESEINTENANVPTAPLAKRKIAK